MKNNLANLSVFISPLIIACLFRCELRIKIILKINQEQEKTIYSKQVQTSLTLS